MPLSITLEQTMSRKQRTPSKPKRTARLLTVRLPKWFLHRQYDLQLLYATSGWPFTLNARSVVQYDSPFFKACRAGDLETIKHLLSSKQASIYDRTPDETTAFEIAIHCGQLEVCKLLRHAGFSAQFHDNDYRRFLWSLEYYVNDFTEHSFSLLRVIAAPNDPDRDWIEEYCVDGYEGVYHYVEILRLLNSAQSDTAMLNLSHLKSYLQCRLLRVRLGAIISYMPYVARVLCDISTVREINAAPDKYAWIVYGLASEIAHEHVTGGYKQHDQWPHNVRQAVCAVVRAGLNPHQTSGKLESWSGNEWYKYLTMTPLSLLCVEATRSQFAAYGYGTQGGWNQYINERLQAWLSGLYSAGVDLLQYAETESACYGRVPDLLAIPWRTEGSIMVVTGPKPEDWHISFWRPCESYARLFWELVDGDPVVRRLTARILVAYPVPEHQDPTIRDLPGSWPLERARVADELESCLLGGADDELAQIEEDLLLLSEADFFERWCGIGEVLESSTVAA